MEREKKRGGEENGGRRVGEGGEVRIRACSFLTVVSLLD